MLGRALEAHAEAEILLPHQAAMLARAAVDDHEAPGQLHGNDEFKAGAATREIDDLAIDGGCLRVENELTGLRDETARPDTRISAVLYVAVFCHGAASQSP